MWNKIADGAILLSSICCSVAAAIVASPLLYYLAGSSNDSISSSFFRTLFCLALGFGFGLCALIVGILRFRKWRWNYRIAWFVLLALPVLCAVIAYLSAGGRTGAEHYEAGFQRWAQSNVDAPEIRAWLATRAPAVPVPPSVVVPVPPVDWPKEVASLHPTECSESPDGIFLTWGKFGTWGDQRQIFIARTPTAPEPAGFFWGSSWELTPPGTTIWTQIMPGVYAWVQSGG